jgi:uncharacterized membrane protein
VNDFVEKCRREWRHLRVPDAVANEMAADLEADLAEGEADGVSPEEVLGTSLFDPRSFAAAWAAERGVIPPASSTETQSKRPLILAAIAALTVIAVIGAALAIFVRSGSVAMVPSSRPRLSPPPDMGQTLHAHLSALDVRRIGATLLLVGLVGIALSALYWFAWGGRRFHTRHIDHDPTRRAY